MPAKGDGITKRKDGRYMARYTVQTPDGPKRKVIYGRKYKEVEKKLAEARGDAARGVVFDADGLILRVGKLAVDDSVRLTVERDGRVRPITAGLAKYSSPITSPTSPWRASRPKFLQNSPSAARL